MRMSARWQLTNKQWAILSYYQRFLLIALLAVARKFILDVNEMSAGHLLGLASVTLALGVTYWMVRGREIQAPL